MSRNEDSRSILSEDEVRELLRDEKEEGSRPSLPRVLLVSRRGTETEFLRRQLRKLGCSVSVAHDPFSALDHLRWRHHDLVLSEFALWADDAALLFERMSTSGATVPVLFVGERDSSFEQAARLAGAAGVLTRPLRASDIDVAVRMALVRPPVDPVPEESRDTDRGGAAVPDELRWLRFFFEARRDARVPRDAGTRLAWLVACLERHLQPRAVLVAERSRAGWRIILQATGADLHEAGSDGSGERLVSLLRTVLDDAGDEPVLSSPLVRLEAPRQGDRRLRCLLDLGGTLPEEHQEFVDELRALLEEVAD